MWGKTGQPSSTFTVYSCDGIANTICHLIRDNQNLKGLMIDEK